MTQNKISTDLVEYSDSYKIDDWIWGKKLGEGAFGSVKVCSLLSDKKKKVAIKTMKKTSKKINEQIENERDILS